jgi:plasmid maintenance system antidote protein VapI
MIQLFIGDVLDAFARKCGYSDQELCDFFGIPQVSIRALGSHQITQGQAFQICHALGLDFAEMLAGISE